MESIWRQQQFEMDEEMPFLENSITVPTSIVDISSDEENDAPMLAAGPSIWQPNMEDWVMQRSERGTTTVPIPVPECSIDQYMELEDGLLPLEYVAFGETMPSPISSVPDHPPPQNVNPPPSSSYASSGSYSLSSIDGPFSPMSVGGDSVSTFVTGSSCQSVRSEESSSTFRTMPSYPCGSMVAQFPRPFPGREFTDRVIPQQEYPTMPTTRTIDYADEIRYEGIDFCTVCGKTYQEIVIDATERYVWGAARPSETTDERNARRRGFVNGLEAGLLLFRTAGLSQPASCDFMPHAPQPGSQFINGQFPTWE